MASVVRLLPLSTVRRIPLLLGSCTSIKQLQMKMTQIAVMPQGGWVGEGGSYSIRVRAVPARVYFCPPVTHKIHLRIKNQNASAWFILRISAPQPLWEGLAYFEMVQQIFSDCKRRSDHHFRDVLRTRTQSQTVGLRCETTAGGPTRHASTLRVLSWTFMMG